MGIRRRWLVPMVAIGLVAGCAAAGPGAGGVAAPTSTAVPPLIVGAGLPTQPAEPWLEAPAVAASALSAPLHAVGCAGSAVVGGLFYALFFPGDFSDDFKAWIRQNCAGPYLVTSAEVARVPQPFPVRALRTPRTGTLPVEEAVRKFVPPRQDATDAVFLLKEALKIFDFKEADRIRRWGAWDAAEQQAFADAMVQLDIVKTKIAPTEVYTNAFVERFNVFDAGKARAQAGAYRAD